MIINKMVILVLVIFLLLYINIVNKETFSNINDKKIIIIGNAPFDKSKDNGTLIDSFEKVVRFNSFKLDNFTKYLGTKTSEWVVSDTHCLLLKKMFIKLPI